MKALGPIGMARYLEEYDNGGTGDYTIEQNKRMNKKSIHLLRKLYNNTITFFTPAFSVKILWIMDKTGKIS